ncbi:MAG: DMT family protein, partial [Flavobacteriales bacterium]|nr:DMT family protein [Flavobacteriales bacterium]
PFTLVQPKAIQEAITLAVFAVFTSIAFKQETLRWNHCSAAILPVAAVFLVFKER